MVIGKFGIWCAAVFAAVSAAALPPAFSVDREGRLRIGDGIGFEWMAYQDWKPSFQQPPALAHAVGFPKVLPERFELEASWQLLDGVACRFFETVETAGENAIACRWRLEFPERLRALLVLNGAIPAAELGGRRCTVDGDAVELPKRAAAFGGRKWKSAQTVVLETSGSTVKLEGEFGFELFSAAGAYRLRLFPKRNGEAAELTLKITAVPAGITAEVREAVDKLGVRRPRVLVDRFDTIRKNAETPLGKLLAKRIVGNAELLLPMPPQPKVMMDPMRMLSASQQILARLNTLATAWVLTGERRFAERAVAELLNAAGYPDWNPQHFLDTAELLMGVSLAYDWLYAELTPEQRDRVAAAIVEKGLKPSFGPKMWWVSTTNNWNQVCHAGLIAGAVAVGDREPELAARIITRAVERLRYSLAASYSPRGAHPEGPGYWIYASDFTALALDMLDAAFNRNFGLADTPGLSQTGDFMQAMTGPTGFTFNCGDTHTFQRRQLSFAMFSLAKRFDRADWLVPWENGMLETYCREKPAWKQDDKRLLPLILTGLRPPVGKVKNGPLGWFSGKSAAAPLAVMRSGWESDAVYFGLTAGSPRRNHGHMDCGAFIYEADGVRWAMDLGAQNYSKLEKVLQIWDMKQDSERWQVFRYGADSHNIVRIGGRPQRVDGKGAITAASGNMIEADLTPVYAGGAERVVRRAGLAADRTLTLTDTLQGVKPGEIISWQMCTRAEAATQTDGSLLLTQGKAFLRLEKNMPGAWEVVAEEELLKPFDQKTGKVKMVRFTVPVPASGAVELSVRFLPGGK